MAAGFIARNQHSIKRAQDKEPTHLFFVDLEPPPDSKNIYQSKVLGNRKIQLKRRRRQTPFSSEQIFQHTSKPLGHQVLQSHHIALILLGSVVIRQQISFHHLSSHGHYTKVGASNQPLNHR